MAVELKATERQRKYLGFLSSQGKEKLGKEFSVRKLAEEKGINWDEMTQEQASLLIEEVKAMLEHVKPEEDWGITTQEILDSLVEEKKQEANKPPASPSLILQVYTKQDKLQAIKIFLEALDIDYVLLQEVR